MHNMSFMNLILEFILYYTHILLTLFRVIDTNSQLEKCNKKTENILSFKFPCFDIFLKPSS